MKRIGMAMATLSLLVLAACAGPVGGGTNGGSDGGSSNGGTADGGTTDGGTDGGSSDGGSSADCAARNFGTVSATPLEIPGISLAGVAAPTCTYIDAYDTSATATVLWISDGDLTAVYDSITQALAAGDGWSPIADEYVNDNYRQIGYYGTGRDGASLSADAAFTAGINASDADFFVAPEGSDVILLSYSSLSS